MRNPLGLASGLLVLLLTAPLLTHAQSSTSIEGTATVLSALYIDKWTPGCNNLHLKRDFIYVTPNVTLPNNEVPAWTPVASGNDLVERFKVLNGDTIRANLKPPVGGRRMLTDGLEPEVDSLDILTESQAHEVYDGTPVVVKGFVYVFTACGWNASLTIDQVRSLYFDSSFSISDYHSTCSYGKVFYNASNNIIIGPIEMPCNGTVSNGVITYNYNLRTKCGAAEQFAFRYYGEQAARAAGYGDFINSTPRRRLVHILPKEVVCPWAGLGSVGCGGSFCVTYIHGLYANRIGVNMHELAHTQGLSHAGRGMDEYGDTSDVMGSAPNTNGYLCMNVGNQFRVGWNRPLTLLYPNNTNAVGNAGGPGRWSIPAASDTDVNHLYLKYDVNDTPFPNMFISLRIRRARYDSILSTTNTLRVFVHHFNGSASERDYNRTLLVATLGVNGTYTSPFLDRGNDANVGGGVRIIVRSIFSANSTAVVELCRFTQLVENGLGCSDGVDNDCDGLVDGADPNCQV